MVDIGVACHHKGSVKCSMHDIIVRGFGFFLIAGEKPWDIGEACSGNCSVTISHLPLIGFGDTRECRVRVIWC